MCKFYNVEWEEKGNSNRTGIPKPLTSAVSLVDKSNELQLALNPEKTQFVVLETVKIGEHNSPLALVMKFLACLSQCGVSESIIRIGKKQYGLNSLPLKKMLDEERREQLDCWRSGQGKR